MTDRDGVESKTKDTVELASNEGQAALLSDLSKVLTSDNHISKTDDIVANKAADVAAAVHDIEASAIGLVSAALGRIIALVKLAGDLLALLGGNPQVAGSSIEDNIELLSGGTDGDGTIELSLRVVLQRDIMPVTDLRVEADGGTLASKLSALGKRSMLNLDRDVNHSRSKNSESKKSDNKTHL